MFSVAAYSRAVTVYCVLC